MSGRTFAIGDIHGDFTQLLALMQKLPTLTHEDTLVFMGDYLDRGPQSAEAIEYLMNVLPGSTSAKIVALRGNHEDAWIGVLDGPDSTFPLVPGNGCMATLASFQGRSALGTPAFPTTLEDLSALTTGSFFPSNVVSWLRKLPYWYEDEHGIYVHGGLRSRDGAWIHPSQETDPKLVIWCRDPVFFKTYQGKRVIFGHTPSPRLPQELSIHTPEDPTDVYIAGDVVGIDTGCGRSGFLSAIELPNLTVYETRA